MMIPYYADDLVTIYHGDCREVLPSLAVGHVLTDPPYGVGLIGSGSHWNAGRRIHGDDEPFDPAHLLALDVPLVLWGANHYASRLPDSRGWLVWNKVIYDGSMGSRAMDKRQAEVELAWTNCVPRPKGYRHLWDGVYRDSEHGERYHPAQKPVELMCWCIGLLPDDGRVVVDPYMGAGPCSRRCQVPQPARHRYRNRRTLLRDSRRPLLSGSPRAGRMTQTARLIAYLRAFPGSSSLEITYACKIVNVTGRVSDARAAGVNVVCETRGDGRKGYRIVEQAVQVAMFGG